MDPHGRFLQKWLLLRTTIGVSRCRVQVRGQDGFVAVCHQGHRALLRQCPRSRAGLTRDIRLGGAGVFRPSPHPHPSHPHPLTPAPELFRSLALPLCPNQPCLCGVAVSLDFGIIEVDVITTARTVKGLVGHVLTSGPSRFRATTPMRFVTTVLGKSKTSSTSRLSYAWQMWRRSGRGRAVGREIQGGRR